MGSGSSGKHLEANGVARQIALNMLLRKLRVNSMQRKLGNVVKRAWVEMGPVGTNACIHCCLGPRELPSLFWVQ